MDPSIDDYPFNGVGYCIVFFLVQGDDREPSKVVVVAVEVVAVAGGTAASSWEIETRLYGRDCFRCKRFERIEL